MTRINVVPVEELCDQHLLAEWRELTRIPNSILSGKLSITNIPEQYTVRTNSNPKGGVGHVKFFTNKLHYLYNRYVDLRKELEEREMPQANYWPSELNVDTRPDLWYNYIPTKAALQLNRCRIEERMPKAPRYARKPY